MQVWNDQRPQKSSHEDICKVLAICDWRALSNPRLRICQMTVGYRSRDLKHFGQSIIKFKINCQFVFMGSWENVTVKINDSIFMLQLSLVVVLTTKVVFPFPRSLLFLLFCNRLAGFQTTSPIFSITMVMVMSVACVVVVGFVVVVIVVVVVVLSWLWLWSKGRLEWRRRLSALWLWLRCVSWLWRSRVSRVCFVAANLVEAPTHFSAHVARRLSLVEGDRFCRVGEMACFVVVSRLHNCGDYVVFCDVLLSQYFFSFSFLLFSFSCFKKEHARTGVANHSAPQQLPRVCGQRVVFFFRCPFLFWFSIRRQPKTSLQQTSTRFFG